MDSPIECLLRPPIELASTASYFSLAALAAIGPGLLFLPSNVGYVISAGLCVLGVMRCRSACKLLAYQRGLKVLKEYQCSPDDIQRSDELLFLGKGFEWSGRHTQRRAEITFRQNKRYAEDLSFAGKPGGYVEGDVALHSVGLYENEEDVVQRQDERVAHTFVVGTTRVGKTRLLEVLATQDIHNGNVVIVFDPKGDAELLARIYLEAKKANRLDDLNIFHLGFPEQSARYNPVGTFSRVTEVAGRIAGQLPNEGNSIAFREFAWRYVNVISKALTEIGQRMSYASLLEFGSNIDPLLKTYLCFVFKREKYPYWEKAVDQLVASGVQPPRAMQGRDRSAWAHVEIFKESGIKDVTAQSLIKTFEYDKTYYDKLVASLFPLLEKLTGGKMASLLSPDYFDLNDSRPIFDWMSVIRKGGIVYVGLDALSDADVAAAVGNSMFSDLTSVAGQIYKYGSDRGLPDIPEANNNSQKRKICLHADEFNELVGREFIPMANKAGGAGFQLTVYTQTLSDIIAKFSAQGLAGQVVGNLGTLIMLRVKELATAELLTQQLDDVDVNYLMLVSATTDSSNPDNDIHFVSRTEQRLTTQRVPLLHPGDLTRLPKGHAFAFIGGRLYKLRLPLFNDVKDLPDGIQQMVSTMQTQSSNNEYWHELTPLLMEQHKI